MRLRLFDYVSFGVALTAIVVFSLMAFEGSEQGSIVRVQVDGVDYVYPLAQDRTIQVDGPLGTTIVEIADRRARVAESPCRDKICIATSWLSQAGDWTACLPNRVFVRVDRAEEPEIDAQTF